MSQESFIVAGRAIGPAEPPYVIAEVGNNHAGDVEAAKVLIAAAAGNDRKAYRMQVCHLTPVSEKGHGGRAQA